MGWLQPSIDTSAIRPSQDIVQNALSFFKLEPSVPLGALSSGNRAMEFGWSYKSRIHWSHTANSPPFIPFVTGRVYLDAFAAIFLEDGRNRIERIQAEAEVTFAEEGVENGARFSRKVIESQDALV